MSETSHKTGPNRLCRQDVQPALDRLQEGIVALDGRRRIVWLNRAACGILQVDRQEAMGMECDELFSEQFRAVASAKREAANSADPREVLLRELQKTGWNVAKTARRLKLSRTAVYQQIARFALKRPQQ